MSKSFGKENDIASNDKFPAILAASVNVRDGCKLHELHTER